MAFDGRWSSANSMRSATACRIQSTWSGAQAPPHAAFQRRYRPDRVDGELDQKTLAQTGWTTLAQTDPARFVLEMAENDDSDDRDRAATAYEDGKSGIFQPMQPMSADARVSKAYLGDCHDPLTEAWDRFCVDHRCLGRFGDTEFLRSPIRPVTEAHWLYRYLASALTDRRAGAVLVSSSPDIRGQGYAS